MQAQAKDVKPVLPTGFPTSVKAPKAQQQKQARRIQRNKTQKRKRKRAEVPKTRTTKTNHSLPMNYQWYGFLYIKTIVYTQCMVQRETVSFVFPRVPMFPKIKLRETSGIDGKQN